MAEFDPLREYVSLFRPQTLLDIGCGCGSFTASMAPYCAEITAIDISESLIERARRDNARPNIKYLQMDGKKLDIGDASIDTVVVRASLHHEKDWQQIIAEMYRVAENMILIEEPIDAPRSEAERNTQREQRLFLELQAEVGYPHYEHLSPLDLTEQLKARRIRFLSNIHRSDKVVSFEEYFESWEHFAAMSNRKEYWLQRLEEFRRELGTGQLSEDDLVFIVAHK